MKIVEESKKKIKGKHVDKPKKDHVLIVAQEIKFARLLSGNEKKSRDKVLKTLKKWLTSCFQKGYEFKEDDFVRVWKGLFYAVWMSDKPLIQPDSVLLDVASNRLGYSKNELPELPVKENIEDLCESIAGILDQFPKEQYRHCLLMVKAGFKVLATEWYGIDYHRIDKYLMLVRRYLRGSLRCLHRTGWTLESCQMYSNMLTKSDGLLAVKTPHYSRNALSMVLHVVDCFLEELSKVSDGEIPEDSMVELLRPFCGYTTSGEVLALCIACRRLLTALVRQSELGLRYNEATIAWKRMGCPKGGPEALELVSDDEVSEDGNENSDAVLPDNDDGIEKKPLDPRAGRVDVLLRPLPVPAAKLAEVLREMLAHASSKAHKRVKICMQRFEKLAQDEYPLPVPRSDAVRDYGPRISTQKSLKSLRALEKNLVAASDELALRGLNRKHRKRLLAKSRSGSSIIEDVEKLKQSITNTTNGDWKVESTEPLTKKRKRDTGEEETKHNKNKKKDKKDKKIRKRKLTSNEDRVAAKKLKITREEEVVTNKTVEKDADVTDTNGETKRIKKKKELRNKPDKNVSKNLNGKNLVDKTTDKEKSKEKDLEEKSKDNKNRKINNEKAVTDKVEKAEKCIKTVEKVKENNKPTLLVNKVKNYQKSVKKENDKLSNGVKRVKFALKNNCMQGPVDYYKSVRMSPSIPFDSRKRPSKTNLKPSTPSPINPFLKKRMRMKN